METIKKILMGSVIYVASHFSAYLLVFLAPRDPSQQLAPAIMQIPFLIVLDFLLAPYKLLVRIFHGGNSADFLMNIHLYVVNCLFWGFVFFLINQIVERNKNDETPKIDLRGL